jgi:hypothetical protein
MIVQYGEISRNKVSNHINSRKDDIINATKAVVRKSILMQTVQMDLAKLENGFH